MPPPPAPDIIGPLGKRRELSVRLGDTLKPRTIVLALGQGMLNMTGARIEAALYLRPSGEPLASPKLEVKQLGDNALGQPRFRLELSADKVRELAALEPQIQLVQRTAPKDRTYHWRCWVIDAAGARYTLYYGPFVVLLGAADAAADG